jgi:hypothetical protein
MPLRRRPLARPLALALPVARHRDRAPCPPGRGVGVASRQRPSSRRRRYPRPPAGAAVALPVGRVDVRVLWVSGWPRRQRSRDAALWHRREASRRRRGGMAGCCFEPETTEKPALPPNPKVRNVAANCPNPLDRLTTARLSPARRGIGLFQWSQPESERAISIRRYARVSSVPTVISGRGGVPKLL